MSPMTPIPVGLDARGSSGTRRYARFVSAICSLLRRFLVGARRCALGLAEPRTSGESFRLLWQHSQPPGLNAPFCNSIAKRVLLHRAECRPYGSDPLSRAA